MSLLLHLRDFRDSDLVDLAVSVATGGVVCICVAVSLMDIMQVGVGVGVSVGVSVGFSCNYS